MVKSDFIIIGAGIAGASIAYELAARGSVVVLEREPQPGYHATGRSAAVYTETYGNPIIHALTKASRTFLERPPGGFTENALVKRRGVLWIGRHDQSEALDRAHEEIAVLLKEIRRLDAESVEKLVPALRHGYVVGGLLEPGAMDIDVDSLLQGFLRGLRSRGGRLITNADVMGLQRMRGGWSVETGSESYQAAVVINAGGAWGDEIARLAKVPPVRLSPKKRTAMIFDPPPGQEVTHWPMVVDVDEKFYFKPEAQCLLGSPADETRVAPGDARPDDLDVATAAERIQGATGIELKRIIKSWAGLRTFSADKSPVVGMEPGAEGFFWLVGQGGYGIMTAPAMARLGACLVVGNDPPEELTKMGILEESLSPGRFQNR